MVVVFNGHSDGMVVDDRNHLPEMFGKQAVEQHFVAIVESSQENVLAQLIRQPPELGVSTGDLYAQSADLWGKQTGEAQCLSFLGRKGSALIEKGRIEHRQATQLGFIETVGPVLTAPDKGLRWRDHSVFHNATSPLFIRPVRALTGAFLNRTKGQ